MDTIEAEDTLGIQFCERQGLVIEKGLGTEVWDTGGTRYLDFTSGWGVTCLGHGHPVIVEALCNQAGKVMQNPNSGFSYSPVRAQLLTLLSPLLPAGLERMFFVNSGAEANDLALKLARKISGKSRAIASLGAFHGRTFNTLSVTGGPENHLRFSKQPLATDFVPYGDFSAIEQKLGMDTAAVILEPIQGEGGVRLPPPDYLQQVAGLCRARGAFLIIDEVQTGFCRTGRLFAIEHAGGEIRPDFLTLGKGLAGGFPMAAVAVSAKVAQGIQKGDHGGTYCGNPLGCAVARAVVEYLITHRVDRLVSVRGTELLHGLTRLQKRHSQLIREVRGIGLLTALELVSAGDVAVLTKACQERGLLVTPTRNGIVRLIPDLLLTAAHLEEALAMLESALEDIGTRVAAAS